MRFKRIIQISYELSEKIGRKKRNKHFSFILSKNKILAIGINNSKTHPLNLKYNYVNRKKNKISEMIGTHSEMNAVLKLKKSCEGLVMVNTRINKKNELAYSKPCNGCLDLIKKLKFDQVFYINKNKKFENLQI